ncbi:MAG: GHKL domain-containing protein [Campylobacteraceae bacterium]|nr:GHKL domain-containing protein [Campylobacteraceae bacterium]MBT6388998.1 GHKL domain-containing protein [Campylobacteraceae bacterium]MBT6577973.1 GHKL domain-containing protein [Campylobacteraceae bacterium]MBT7274773.1 GHKL domain-containing protein [Campylobacteraceae bacterium]
MQILIDNNISNAIKYSYPNSTININLKIKNSGYLLEFIDYGIGIKDTDKLFTRYYREESTTGGFGIGLNIVKSILDQYNITLNIKSELKKGSTFSYIFPEEILSL